MLEGKNAIITGANRGIGRATVEVFAKNKANIWACARKQNDVFEKEMIEVAQRYNVEIFPIYFDLTDDEQIKQAIQTIIKSKRNIDVLVNIAGIADSSTSFFMTPIEKMKKTFEVNFFSTTCLTQYVSRLMMRKKSGSIVNISSIAGIDGEPAQYEYASSKAALIGGTRELARELGQYNIRVNAIAPGMIDTEMGSQIEDELKKRILEKVIMKRLGKPEEIANVIAFLASDYSSFMTGQIIRVDGGM